MARHALTVSLLVLLLGPAAGRLARATERACRVRATDAAGLRAALAGSTCEGVLPLKPGRRPTREAAGLARQIRTLLPRSSATYSQILVTALHVGLFRRDGLVELLRGDDALARLRLVAGASCPGGVAPATIGDKIQVGVRSMGFPLFAEQGPNNTVYLYRQIPMQAKGELASAHCNTSFALRLDDAYHPFGAAGRTLRVAVPREVFDDAVEGRAGGVGWNDKGGGWSLGLDVEQEVQIPSGKIRELFP